MVVHFILDSFLGLIATVVAAGVEVLVAVAEDDPDILFPCDHLLDGIAIWGLAEDDLGALLVRKC